MMIVIFMIILYCMIRLKPEIFKFKRTNINPQTHENLQSHEKETLLRMNDEQVRVMFQKETLESPKEHRFSVNKLNQTTEPTINIGSDETRKVTMNEGKIRIEVKNEPIEPIVREERLTEDHEINTLAANRANNHDWLYTFTRT